jgi:hypothetical protein
MNQEKIKDEDISKSSSFGVELLNKLQTKQITQEEFNKELGYWMLHTGFDNQFYMQVPKPEGILKEYYDLSHDDRKKITKDFFEQEEVRTFMAKKSEAQKNNNDCIGWLQDLLGFLPEDDSVNRERVSEKSPPLKTQREGDNVFFEPSYVSKATIKNPNGKDNGWDE